MTHWTEKSYASKDKPIADAVCAAVEAKGFRCWIAPRDVLPGMPYGEAIIDAIQASRVMVLVFSSNANASTHISKEVERAATTGVTIIPLRIEDVTPAKSLDYFIHSVHWLDAITPPLEQHLNKLAETISKTLSIEDSIPQAASETGALLASSGSRPIATNLRGAPAESRVPDGVRSRRLWRILIPLSAIVVSAVAGVLYFRSAHAAPLSDKDTIVLADFTNSTGDPVFDGTLRQGLAVQLEQSPFLSLLSEESIQQTLRLMNRSTDTHLTPEIARELCQRTESAAVLDGSIFQIGTQYSLILKAANCSNGKLLASAEAQASGKNQVLDALTHIAAETRKKLGESLSTLQRFDTPLEQATTPSIDALQAYSRGWKYVYSGDDSAAVPLFQRAIQFDPNFAMAYSAVSARYNNLGQVTLAAENARKGFELRERVSEREKFYIESHYYHFAVGNLEKARQVYEVWSQYYPREYLPLNNQSGLYSQLGQYDKALAESLAALRLAPWVNNININVTENYIALNRLDDARASAEAARAKKLDSFSLHLSLYKIAFLKNDEAGMVREVTWAAGKPGVEDAFLDLEAGRAAYYGRLRKARELSRRAVASAEQAEEKEVGASYEAEAAVWEALFGNPAEARQRAVAALRPLPGPDVQYAAILALIIAGETDQARAIADSLSEHFPENTVVQFNYMPTIRAQLSLSGYAASQAINYLQDAAPYELGDTALHPVYVRGAAYLAENQGNKAATEFQKILGHRGVVWNAPTGALAHLGLARAYALQHAAKARVAYQDFLSLWKDADSDIPILKQAKTELAKLQ